MVEITGGMQSRELERAPSKMIINPHGSRVELLQLEGRDLLTTVTRGDGKVASTHPCTPNFGPDTQGFGLKQHGDSRNSDFQVITFEPEHVVLSRDIKEGTYPEGMNIWQEYELKDGIFRLKTIHKNNGTVKAPVNLAHHFYWDTPNGWEGTKVNGEDVTELIKTDVAKPWQEENIIEFPGQAPIYVHQKGMPFAMYWVGKAEGKDGQEEIYDTQYAAIEAVERDPNTFGQPQTMIEPGESRETEVTIGLKP